jgi:chemotaxis protein MotB
MRRRRKAASEASASHDRWLVSYADFITLLFAFFVVLFASAYRDNQAIIRVSSAVHNGFQSLGVLAGGEKKGAIAYSGVPTETPFAPAFNASSKGLPPGPSAQEVLTLQQQLRDAIGNELKNKEIELTITPEGFVISLKELGFFNSGQAALLPGAAEKIKRIAKILSSRSLELRIEGHTDNQPIHNDQFNSNWELSTARAMAVLTILVGDAGFDPRKVSVAGFGEYRPIADDATPEGRGRNRRVDMVVVSGTPIAVDTPQAGPIH